MAYLLSTFTFETEQKGNFSGLIAHANADWSKIKRIYPPPHVSTIEGRPSGGNYTNRQFLVGGHSRNILIDEDFRCLAQGMWAPTIEPSVTAGAGTTPQLAYLRFYDEITGERSPLSRSHAFTGNTTRAWTALPTVMPTEIVVVEGTSTFAAGAVTGVATNFHDLRPGDRIAKSSALTRWAQIRSISSSTAMVIDDTGMAGAAVALTAKPVSRASHVEGWLAVNGALPRFVFRVRIGVTSYNEAIATLALGEPEIDSFEPMPTGRINVLYNDRQAVAGVEGQLDTLFLSALTFLERHEGLRFRTDYGEPIIGLFRYRQSVTALCPASAYRLQGYTEDDLDFQPIEFEQGGLGHHGNAVAGGIVYIPDSEQIQAFNGAFHGAMPTRQAEWAAAYRENQTAFELGIGAVDRESQTYRFMPFPMRLGGQFEDTPVTTLSAPGGPGIYIIPARYPPDPVDAAVNSRPLLTYNVGTATMIEDYLHEDVAPFPPFLDGRGLGFGSDSGVYVAGALFVGAGLVDPGVYRLSETVPPTLVKVTSLGDQVDAVPPTGQFQANCAEDPNAPGSFVHYYAAFVPGAVAKTYYNGVLDDTPVWHSLGIPAQDWGSQAPHPRFFVFNGSIYGSWGHPLQITAGPSVDTIRKRVGTLNWTNLTMPAPPGTSWGFMGIGTPVVYNDKAYVPGIYFTGALPGAEIEAAWLSVDSADTVTKVHSKVAPCYPGDPVVFNGKLYYPHYNANALGADFEYPTTSALGKFDGAVWTDAEWNGVIGPQQYIILALVPYGNTLYAILGGPKVGGTHGQSLFIAASNGFDTTAWTLVHTSVTHAGEYFRVAGVMAIEP